MLCQFKLWITFIIIVRNSKWMGFLTRDVMESANSYSEAKEILMKQELLAPAYYILGGNSTGEGVIITRALDEVKDVQVNCVQYTSHWWCSGFFLASYAGERGFDSCIGQS